MLRMLLLSHGPSTPGSALVWVAADDAAAVADAVSGQGRQFLTMSGCTFSTGAAFMPGWC